ncbi:MAG: hypothetical protein GF393_03410, partial [Armatimonadia bacterium]|nr:hypothetical protein [Armatimonadia bacterium]
MKRWSIRLACVVALAMVAVVAFAEPQVGYVYPAGGQQGTTFTVEVGGQALWSVDSVRVSGDGVRASVVEYVRALDNNELRDTRRFLPNIVKRRWIASVMEQAEKDGAALPDHPWLRDLDEKSPAELERLRVRLFDEKAQPNAQIAEKVIIEVTIAPDAEPGDRELRLFSPDGLSNPLCFQVGVLPELREVHFA